MSKSVYVIHLTGIGESEIRLLEDKALFDFIMTGTNPPDYVQEYAKAILAKDEINPGDDDYDESYQRMLMGYGSSMQNDRALQFASVDGREDSHSCWDLKGMLKWLKDNDAEVIETYEGMIY